MIRLVPSINLMTTPDERKAADRADNAEADALGLRCPACGCRLIAVDDTRAGVNRINRRRKCANCGKRYRTKEVIDAVVQQRNTTGCIHPAADEEFYGAR